MTDKLTRKSRSSTLALIGVLAALGIAPLAIPTVAAASVPAGQAGGNHHASEWVPAGEPASSGKAPSLTNQVDEPERGGGSQLWLGYGLLGAGLLALACGLAARGSKPRGAPIAARSHAGSSSAARGPATARARP